MKVQHIKGIDSNSENYICSHDMLKNLELTHQAPMAE